MVVSSDGQSYGGSVNLPVSFQNYRYDWNYGDYYYYSYGHDYFDAAWSYYYGPTAP